MYSAQSRPFAKIVLTFIAAFAIAWSSTKAKPARAAYTQVAAISCVPEYGGSLTYTNGQLFNGAGSDTIVLCNFPDTPGLHVNQVKTVQVNIYSASVNTVSAKACLGAVGNSVVSCGAATQNATAGHVPLTFSAAPWTGSFGVQPGFVSVRLRSGPQTIYRLAFFDT